MAEMKLRDLHQLRRDLQERIERCHRVLKDHRDPLAADLSHLIDRQRTDIDAVKDDLAADDLSRRFRDQPHHREIRHRFAAARFADDAERLALFQLERDPVNRLDDAVFGLEIGLQVVDR